MNVLGSQGWAACGVVAFYLWSPDWQQAITFSVGILKCSTLPFVTASGESNEEKRLHKPE